MVGNCEDVVEMIRAATELSIILAAAFSMFVPALRARKLRRKAKRYLAHIRERYQADVPVETEIG